MNPLQLSRPLLRHPDSICLKMRKFVLNGNRLDWATINRLIAAMPLLEELHLASVYYHRHIAAHCISLMSICYFLIYLHV